MTFNTTNLDTAPYAADDIKRVPADPAVRDAVRARACAAAAGWDRTTPPTREELEARADALLRELSLQPAYTGFAMVALSNAFWQEQYAAVPLDRRLLLLPHCLRDSASCSATYDSIGLQCAACGLCNIHGLKEEAEGLGYQVIVAEGTSSVIMKVLDGDADAILGVACLDSLEKSYARVRDLGVPHVAVPLLANGCRDTEAETGIVRGLLRLRGETAAAQTHSYIPLLRLGVALFHEPAFTDLLAPLLGGARGETDDIALDWLKTGGKRLRPFVTLAAYAVTKHGEAALAPHADVEAMTPSSVRRLALAIETLHKASLVHDDVEDDDRYRYGRQTLHRRHGVPPAINVGDYLIGLGYRLVASCGEELGAACVTDVVSDLSRAHLELCRGQGAELLWHERGSEALRPVDALAIYARKTAPAFEAALYAGLRAAAAEVDRVALRQFATYLGEAYQIVNDLEDWHAQEDNKVALGQDVLAGRPTILRAFALEAGAGEELARLTADRESPREAITERACLLYTRTAAFAKAETLRDRLRERALRVAADAGAPALAELLAFLARVVLQDRREPDERAAG